MFGSPVKNKKTKLYDFWKSEPFIMFKELWGKKTYSWKLGYLMVPFCYGIFTVLRQTASNTIEYNINHYKSI